MVQIAVMLEKATRGAVKFKEGPVNIPSYRKEHLEQVYRYTYTR